MDIGALRVRIDPPFRFASGILSPLYCDNRLLLSHPPEREQVVGEFLKRIENYSVDGIAGTATAGIPHAAWIAQALKLPMYYVRSQSKSHGKQEKIEGGSVNGMKIALIEDLVTTGGSAISALETLQESGAEVVCCISIFSYGFPKAVDEFDQRKIPYESLGTFKDLFSLLEKSEELSEKELGELRTWHENPGKWNQGCNEQL